MKNIAYFMVLMILMVSQTLAQPPQGINYQAVARDNSGNLLSVQTVRFRISILQGSPSGTVVFSESHLSTTNAYGVSTLKVGQGTLISGNFSSIDWGGSSYFIQTEMDPTGGTSYQMMGTSEFLSVPYAFYAEETGSGGGVYQAGTGLTLDGNTFNSVWTEGTNSIYNNNSGNVGIGTTSPNEATVLDIYSTDKAFLIPRMTTASRLVILPVNGMMVYDSDLNQFYVYEKGNWVWMQTGAAIWERNAFFGRTTLANSGDNVGLGVSSPAEQLHLSRNLRMPTSTATNGNIYKDANVFLHNVGSQNTFLGVLSGNLSLTGSDNIAMGYRSAYSFTTGTNNTAIGSQALSANTTGNQSVAVGYKSLYNQAGNAIDNNLANTAIGTEALFTVNPTTGTDGRYNTALGYRSGYSLTNGFGNVLIGNLAAQYGTPLTTGNNNVIIGFNANAGDDGRSNVVLIGANTQSTAKNQVRLGDDNMETFFCMGAYTAETVDPPNLAVDGNGQIMRSTASVPMGSGAPNKVAIWDDAGSLTYNNNLHWDNTNQRLGVGASSLSAKFTVGNGTYATFVVEAPDGLTGAKNLLAGIGAGRALTTGEENTIYGYKACYYLTTGSNNIAIGNRALYTSTTSTKNIAIGDHVLFNNTSGYNNVAVGQDAMASNYNGYYNTAIGDSTLWNNYSGYNNVAVGKNALMLNQFGYLNTAVGSEALKENASGNGNSAFGSFSLKNNVSGIYNVALGYGALVTNESGSYNTATGPFVLNSNTEGSHNSAYGMYALRDNTLGSDNAAFGYGSLSENTTGDFNCAFGRYALGSNTEGGYNCAFGVDALASNTVGSRNIAIGTAALHDNEWSSHIAIGDSAMYHHIGVWNAIVNTAIGNYALFSNLIGGGNTCVGERSLMNSVGNGNTALGRLSGYNHSPDYSTFIGYHTNSTADCNNSTALGAYSFVTADYQVRIGFTDILSIGGYTDWTNISDGRYKFNVREDVAGLDFILKLRPVTYQLDVEQIDKDYGIQKPSEDHSRSNKANIVQSGFIAQEVEQAAQSLGFSFSGVDAPKNDNDLYGLRYAQFVVPLVKAMQEQQEVIERLQKRVEELEKAVNSAQ